jgi:hypothetical protein
LDGLTAGMNYIVEFFTIPSGSGDPSGFGEGNSYVEAYVHTSISAGTEVFEYTFSSPISPGDLISATVTGPNNSTSEFSNHLVVENEQALTVDLITNESCGGMNDGGITVSTSGGAAPITYEWYNSSIVLVGSTEDLASVPSETYSLYSTSASGCIVSSSGNVVSTDPAISVSATTSNYSGYSITCFGASDGQINLTISGGTGVYSISLDGGATWPLNGIT